MELTINKKVYKFKAGIGFLRKINKTVTTSVQGSDERKEVGLRMMLIGLMDGEIEDLINALDFTNEGLEPRITRKEIETYIEEVEDIDELFDKFLDFFEKANVSKRTMKLLKKQIEEAMSR